MACASDPTFPERVVTRAEYLENGSIAVRRKFPDWQPPPPPLREPAKEKPRETGRERPSVKEKPRETAKGKGKQREEPAAVVKVPKTRVRVLNPVVPPRKR
jgi:actin-related protein 6